MADDPQQATEPGERAAAPGSALAALRSRRQKARDELTIDLVVPRSEVTYGAPIVVRYAPLPLWKLNEATQKATGSKERERAILANAGNLAFACRGIFEEVDGDLVPLDPDADEAPRFDALGPLLGVEGLTAVQAVRELYLTDGDVFATAAKIGEFSGFSAEQLERPGN